MKREIRGDFKTSVTIKMIVFYVFAWITNKEVKHKDILIEIETMTPKKNNNKILRSMT